MRMHYECLLSSTSAPRLPQCTLEKVSLEPVCRVTPLNVMLHDAVLADCISKRGTYMIYIVIYRMDECTRRVTRTCVTLVSTAVRRRLCTKPKFSSPVSRLKNASEHPSFSISPSPTPSSSSSALPLPIDVSKCFMTSNTFPIGRTTVTATATSLAHVRNGMSRPTGFVSDALARRSPHCIAEGKQKQRKRNGNINEGTATGARILRTLLHLHNPVLHSLTALF